MCGTLCPLEFEWCNTSVFTAVCCRKKMKSSDTHMCPPILRLLTPHTHSHQLNALLSQRLYKILQTSWVLDNFALKTMSCHSFSFPNALNLNLT